MNKDEVLQGFPHIPSEVDLGDLLPGDPLFAGSDKSAEESTIEARRQRILTWLEEIFAEQLKLDEKLDELQKRWAKEAWACFLLTREIAKAKERGVSLQVLLSNCAEIATQRICNELDPNFSFQEALNELLGTFE